MDSRNDWRDELSGGLTSLLPGVGPLLSDPMRRLTAKAREEISRLQSRAIHAAEATSGLSREELAERIAANPRLVPITIRVLFEAGMTGQDEVLVALGAALGSAVDQPEASDDIEVILLGLAGIRRLHILVLRSSQGTPKWLGMPGEDLDPETANTSQLIDAEHWTVEALAVVSQLPTDQVSVGATGLVNAGFLRGIGAIGSMGYRITPLGMTLLDALDRYNKAQSRA